MKKELEICVRSLVSFDEMKQKMISMGFHIQEDFQLNDIYMIKQEKEVTLENDIFSSYILIRETVGKKIMLVLKNKTINEKGEIINQTSLKCPISKVDDGYNFMIGLGYKKVFELKDHNILLSNGKNEIYIQDVEGLGVYVEMEQKNILLNNNNGDSLEQLIANLKKYQLPIDENDFFVKKSYDMLKKISNDL